MRPLEWTHAAITAFRQMKLFRASSRYWQPRAWPARGRVSREAQGPAIGVQRGEVQRAAALHPWDGPSGIVLRLSCDMQNQV